MQAQVVFLTLIALSAANYTCFNNCGVMKSKVEVGELKYEEVSPACDKKNTSHVQSNCSSCFSVELKMEAEKDGIKMKSEGEVAVCFIGPDIDDLCEASIDGKSFTDMFKEVVDGGSVECKSKKCTTDYCNPDADGVKGSSMMVQFSGITMLYLMVYNML